MRYLALLLILALAATAALLPEPDGTAPGPAAGIEEPPVSVCPIQEGSGRSTEVAVLSTADGPVQLTLFTGGGAAGSLGTETGTSGSTVIPVSDVAAVGTVGGLVELPVATSAAGVRVSGAASFMAESCASIPAQQTFLSGGSTTSGETFVMQLMNPYAGEAIVSLEVTSEAGIESNERFASVVVPPRSSTIVDFTTLIPGRERLSALVETTRGRVIAIGQQGVEGDSSMWNSLPPSQDWFVPFPRGGGNRRLILATPSAVAVDYQIDVYGPEGLQEAFITGTLESRGQVSELLSDITEEAAGLRVISTGPVVPTLRVDSEAGYATTTGASSQSNRWMLPGAGAREDGGSTVIILNASLDEAEISVRPLREESVVNDITLAPDSVVQMGLEPADGYLIDSTSPVVVLWMAVSPGGRSAAVGVPLSDG